MMDAKLIGIMKTAAAQYELAKKNNMGVSDKKQALCNILLSHVNEIVDTALDAEFLMKKSREDAAKIAELQDKIKELTAPEQDAAEPEKQAPVIGKKNG